MKKSGSILLLVLLAAVFGGGVWYLCELQYAAGDVYPAYSTLRSDPAGAKLIFESLSRLPGVTAIRSYRPLERLLDRDSTVLLLGLEPRAFAMQSPADLRTFEEFAARGNRLVLSMGPGSGRAPPRQTALEKLWGVRFGLDFDKDGNDILYFAAAKNWEVLKPSAQGPLVVEKAFGKGSIVLVAAGRLFGNKAVAEARQTALLTGIIRPQTTGPPTRILFDEAHFGIVESGSVVALARRFRLHGLALGLALCTVLFIWRNASGFPPVSSVAPTEKVFGRTSVSGLVTLLRRHIAPDRLVLACWQAWRKSHSREIPSGRLMEAEAAVRKLADRPAEALREIQAILHAKSGGADKSVGAAG
ncbi:MAG: DUF4350 domain-containing protein [Bryobacteraceae bacterium]|jgi:hypothetical protein